MTLATGHWKDAFVWSHLEAAFAFATNRGSCDYAPFIFSYIYNFFLLSLLSASFFLLSFPSHLQNRNDFWLLVAVHLYCYSE